MLKINNRKSNRVGEIRFNNFGSKMIIMKYNNRKDIDIYFPATNYVVYNRAYKDFLNGQVSSLYDKTVLGIGYFGKGKYKCSINVERKSKVTSAYQCWSNMLHRCYDNKLHKKRPTYKDCIVLEEWLNFQKFAKWHEENYYQVGEEEMHLDKDILVKGNKVYSPETCIFVPIRINSLFKTNNSSNLPIGISTKLLKYAANCRDENLNNTYLGIFETIEEAFNVYKLHKEKVIKLIAEKYKGGIPKKLYDAMYNYKVEITD